MKIHRSLWVAGAALVLLGAGQMATSADAPGKRGAGVALSAGQKDFFTQEPILVTARLNQPGAVLPAGPGKTGATTLRFEISPAVKARPGAKPLPLETAGADLPTTLRTYDLLEWFQFPAQGSWTVYAIVEHKGTAMKSLPLAVTIARPAKGDKELSPVDRLHHMPWSNYTTNAFCGDCFDLVKQWPQSRLARYAHYWNGVYHQNKKEYDKAYASYQTAATQYPDFVLANHARCGMVECLLAQKNMAKAQHENQTLREQLRQSDPAGTSTAKLFCDRVARQVLSAARGGAAGTVRKE